MSDRSLLDRILNTPAKPPAMGPFQTELRNADLSLSDKLRHAMAKPFEWAGQDGRHAQEWGDRLSGLLRSIDPVTGMVTSIDNATRDMTRNPTLAQAGKSAAEVAMSTPALARSHLAKTPGTPETFKLPDGRVIKAEPIPGIAAAAHDYARSAGLPSPQAASLPKQDPDRARRIAGEYERMPHAPHDPAVQQSYRKMADETLAQYDKLIENGYSFQFMKPDGKGGFVDPYAASPALGYMDLKDNKKLQIFPTEGGFGSSALDVSTNPLLGPAGRKFGDQDATYNDVFRAVHDSYGHFGQGNAFFRAPGEERAWQHHSLMYSPEARGAMTSETRGQNSWVNFGPHGEKNRKASGADTTYADQKTGIMPEWTYADGAAKNIEPRYAPSLAPFSFEDGNP